MLIYNGKHVLFICDQILSFKIHSNSTEAVLIACLSSGWATTTGRLLGSKMRNSIKCLSQRQSHRRATASGVKSRFRNLLITSSALHQLDHAAAAYLTVQCT